MWPSQSYTLASLTILTPIKRKLKWTQVKQDAFDKIKRIVAHNTLSTYPYFNEEFKIHADDVTFQLGEVMSHKEKTIAFYSRKLTDAQQQYTVIEGELLNIV